MNNLFNQKPGEEKEEQVDKMKSDEALEEVNDHHMEDQVVKTCPSPPSGTYKLKYITLHLLHLLQADYHIQNLSFSTCTSEKQQSPIVVYN